jgi:hypothetical protein
MIHIIKKGPDNQGRGARLVKVVEQNKVRESIDILQPFRIFGKNLRRARASLGEEGLDGSLFGLQVIAVNHPDGCEGYKIFHTCILPR